MMGWVADVLQGFKDIPIAAVLEQRILLKEEQYKKLEAEKIEIINTVAVLDSENKQLRQELNALRATDNFVSSGGVHWKLKPGGGYEETPYCPECKRQLTVVNPRGPKIVKCIIHKQLIVDPQTPKN